MQEYFVSIIKLLTSLHLTKHPRRIPKTVIVGVYRFFPYSSIESSTCNNKSKVVLTLCKVYEGDYSLGWPVEPSKSISTSVEVILGVQQQIAYLYRLFVESLGLSIEP
jgi:hypothetical protein